jgi:uncharacterized SAM-binding protein YcdF (DUF218 family)
MRGTFRGVVHGEFETGPHLPVVPLIAAVLAVAFVSWLATVLLLLAIIAAALFATLAAAFWLLRPHSDRDAAALAEQSAAVSAERSARLRAEMTARHAPAAVENHYHLHLSPGTDASGANWAALPPRDAADEIKENRGR